MSFPNPRLKEDKLTKSGSLLTIKQKRRSSEFQAKKWKIGWGVTSLCNMQCPFCYSRSARDCGADMSFEAMKAFVDTNHHFIDSINYGTGENTLSGDWFELLKYVHQGYPDIKQALTTNGYLAPAIKKRDDGDLILASLDEMDVSLDFFEAERHASFRDHTQAYKWALETIELCRSAGITTTIVVLGLDETLAIENISKIFALAEKYGCYVRVNIFRPNDKQALDLLSYEVLREALLYIVKNHVIVSLCDPLFSELVLGVEVPDPSGTTSLRVLPDGFITPSTYLVTREWRLAHIKNAFLGGQQLCDVLSRNIQTTKFPTACSSCDLRELCKGGAIDRRIIWYGTINERDPYCPFRHGGTEADWHIDKELRFASGPRIHDGYLPTLIFASDGQERLPRDLVITRDEMEV